MRHAPSRALALFITLSLLVVSAPPAPACGGPSYNEAQLSKNVQEMATKVALLWTGSEDERSWIAEDPHPHFQVFDMEQAEEHPEEHPEELGALVASLRLWVRVEPDDWIVTQVLSGLEAFESPRLDPVFLEGLDHPSRNVRAASVRRFVRHRLPEATRLLEALWADSSDREIRTNAMLALACQGSTRFARRFLSDIDSEYPALASAAIAATGKLRPEGAREAVLGAARSKTPEVRASAFRRLAGWPDSESAKKAVLRGLRDSDDMVSHAAFSSLRAFSGEDVDSEFLRAAASDDLRRRLDGFSTYRDRTGLDDASVIELLRRDPAYDEEYTAEFETQQELAKYFAQLMALRGDTCDLSAVLRDPAIPEQAKIVAGPGVESVRCYSRPGITHDPAWKPRVRVGARMFPGTTFESNGERWWVSWNFFECWLPESSLEFSEDNDVGDSDEESIREFDLTPEEIGNSAVTSLVEAGALELFDRVPEAVGARIATEPSDDAIRLLVTAAATDESILALQLFRWIEELEESHPDHEIWKTFSLDDIEERMEGVTWRLFEVTQERLPEYRRLP